MKVKDWNAFLLDIRQDCGVWQRALGCEYDDFNSAMTFS